MNLLKVDFWIHGPVAADTSDSERLLFVGLPLYDVSAATGPCIQKSTFNQSRIYFTHAQIRGMTFGHVSFRWT